MTSKLFLVFAILTTLFSASAPISAQVVAYTTFSDSNEQFALGSGPSIDGASASPGQQSLAMSFAPTVSGNLSTIDFGIFTFAQTEQAVEVTLYSNNPSGGPLLTNVLATGSIAAPLTAVATTYDYSGLPLDLVAGQTYWVALSAGNPGTEAVWGRSAITSPTQVYFSQDGGSTYMINHGGGDIGLFQVNVVPEPSTFALGLIAFAVVIYFRIRTFGLTKQGQAGG